MSDENPNLIAQGLIAAIFGMVFVCVLLVIAFVTPEPSAFQEWIYRVVMSLAAGGIGAIIPGLLTFHSPWIKAGGAMACFAIVYLVNPPSFASQKLRSQAYFDLMDSGNTAMSRNDHVLAKHLYVAAIQLAPDAYLPYQKLATIEFDAGEFKNAELNYQKAFDQSRKSNPDILYNIALSQEGRREYALAIQTFEKLASAVQSDKDFLHDIKFSIAQLKLKIWLSRPADSNPYVDAVNGFVAFLEARQDPPYWAHYHLACLYATQAASDASPDDKRVQLDADVSKEMTETFDGMDKSPSKKAKLHKKMLHDVLSADVKNPLPGNPVPCPALRIFAKQRLPAELLRIVNATEN